uniref:Armadillo repeat-containing domain-containing protein n=1 Tax=Mola mola TaxID=94237 RepID=A0A3Q3X562_MOLML
MGDGSFTPRLGNMKALLGIVAGAGASYGIYRLISGGSFKRSKKNDPSDTAGVRSSQPDEVNVALQRGSLLAKDLIREFEGIPIIAGFLSDPEAEARVQTLNALNNLCMNLPNQEQIKVYVPQVLELIEVSPVNSDLQLGALRLLTNLSVTDKHQHLLKKSITLLLSILVVSNETLQVQALKVLVNLSSNPDMMDDIVQAQVRAPASVILLIDARTSPAVLRRLLLFVGNLKAWRPSAQVADELRRKQDCLFRVMLDESSQFHSRLVQVLSHPDGEIQAQVARILA